MVYHWLVSCLSSGTVGSHYFLALWHKSSYIRRDKISVTLYRDHVEEIPLNSRFRLWFISLYSWALIIEIQVLLPFHSIFIPIILLQLTTVRINYITLACGYCLFLILRKFIILHALLANVLWMFYCNFHHFMALGYWDWFNKNRLNTLFLFMSELWYPCYYD